MRSFALSLALFASFSAFAAPLQFNHQGRLLDDAGAPLTGTASITLSLYADATSSSAAWTEVHPEVALDAGYYSLSVGSISTIDASFFDGSTKYVGISVDGTELPTRVPVLSVPYALRAGSAGLADGLAAGATVDAGSLTLDGSPVFSGGGLAAGFDNDTLGDLNCSTDQVPVFDGSDWTCGEAGSELTSVPAEIITGTIAIANLPVGTGSTQVASGDHTHSAAEIGAVALGTFGETCTATGQLTWSGTSVYACNGTRWVKLGATADGSGQANAGLSCLAILNANPGAANGTYWVDPDGAGNAAPAQVTCDMTGGGWTRGYISDFANNATGWSNNGRSTCGSIGPLLGGFDVFGIGSATQLAVDLTGKPHTQIRVNHVFVKIDSWDNQPGVLQLDGNTIWSKNYGLNDGAQVCGQNTPQYLELADAISTVANHTGNTATIRFSSGLDEAASNESWGLKEVVVWYR